MKLLLTIPEGPVFDMHFPAPIMAQLHAFGEVVQNPTGRPLTKAGLIALLDGVDIAVTHWGTPQFDAEVLDHAPQLRLLAHAAGTVAHIASEECYTRGIPVLSANSVMAPYVAEGILGYMLLGLRESVAYDRQMKGGELWLRRLESIRTLIGSTVGFIGLGTVGRRLLDLLAPFGCRVKVYDPYVPADALSTWPFAALVSLEEALACPVVSIHAAQTPETYHLLNAQRLRLLPDGALLVNAARGSLVEETALVSELSSGRLRAVLDVFEQEPLPLNSLYRTCTNAVLQPHMAGAPAQHQMTQAVVDDIRRFLAGEPLRLAVPLSQYRLMTQE